MKISMIEKRGDARTLKHETSNLDSVFLVEAFYYYCYSEVSNLLHLGGGGHEASKEKQRGFVLLVTLFYL